ncbi:hypothetical protein F4680DRAFT_403366 [Xylaria scruposa]|nr:hypothetical protein F4680DRAFT_403366 [Xylaria scruposa]
MELLRQTALSAYDEYENFDASSIRELKIIRIYAGIKESDDATCEVEDVFEANVLNRLSTTVPASIKAKLETGSEETEAAAASLLLVSMWTSSNGNASEGVGISKTVFLALIDALKIDQCVLQPIVNNVFGLLEFNESVSGSPQERSTCSTYFLADSRIELLWSFDFATSETRAILINRRGPPDPENQKQSCRALADFLAALRQQRNHIFSPYNLLYISLVHMTTWEAKSRAVKWVRVRAFEQETGYGRYGDGALTGPGPKNNDNGVATLEDLTVAAKHIETLRASLASDERHMDIIDSLLDMLEGQSPRWQQRSDGTVAKQRLALCNRDAAVFFAGLRPLRQRNAASQSALKYMAERARSQSHVIFALRGQEESRINREIAETSRDLAEAAKRDAASMKTIAVMTMAFLPGTFFAALFSVPSLRWDQEVVVTEHFWVYWVFTLPVTAFVFLIWMVLCYDDRFKTAVDGYYRRRKDSMKVGI